MTYHLVWQKPFSLLGKYCANTSFAFRETRYFVTNSRHLAKVFPNASIFAFVVLETPRCT